MGDRSRVGAETCGSRATRGDLEHKADDVERPAAPGTTPSHHAHAATPLRCGAARLESCVGRGPVCYRELACASGLLFSMLCGFTMGFTNKRDRSKVRSRRFRAFASSPLYSGTCLTLKVRCSLYICLSQAKTHTQKVSVKHPQGLYQGEPVYPSGLSAAWPPELVRPPGPPATCPPEP